ncbi:MAG: transglycosylase domain-containing protein, partial [Rhizobiales bacterium]|nr:transglycosylase domain-containing protein [Hyphomicrobiales bacterium]
MFLALWGAIGVGGILIYFAAELPQISEISIPERAPNVQILARDGTLIANRGETGGETVRLEHLPPYLPQAVMAIEDRRFLSHFGIDPLGLARAMVSNYRAGRVVQGGSTLTQQLAKILFLSPERTLRRKIQEAVLALWLEQKFTKAEIMEMYLNRVYLGAGATGVDAAARTYFHKSARYLTLSEAAIIAGLLKAPSRLAPNRNLKGAHARARLVLGAMLEEGYITASEREYAITNAATAKSRHLAGSENYAADWLFDRVKGFLGKIEQDVVVETTIDMRLQKLAESALRTGLDRDGKTYGVEQGAIISIDPTGAVRALVGGYDYGKSQFNRAVDAHRQPGSAFKPFVYLAALEIGLTPDTVRIDGPVEIQGWTPQNYNKKYRGPVTLEQALNYSLNTVAARLADEVGIERVAEVANRLGINSNLQLIPSLALGTSETTPLEMTSAYVPFSNGGFSVIEHAIERISTSDGKVIYERQPSGLLPVVTPYALGLL